MKAVKIQSILFLLVSFFSVQTAIVAQTMDNPMPLTEGRLTVSSSNEVTDYYYTFDAQVGEIVITGDGMGNASLFFVGLLNQDFKAIKTTQSFATGTPTRRAVMRIPIGKAQKVLLKIKAPKNPNSSLVLRIEGTAQFGGSFVIPTDTGGNTGGDMNGNNGNTSPTTNPNTGQTTTDTPQTTDNISVNQSSLHKVMFTLKNGQVLEGTFGDFQIVNIGDHKIGLTIRLGKNLPQAQLKDIKSITIE